MKYIFEEIDISTPIMPDAICIKRTDEQGNVAWIPNVRGNSDYEHYLRWLNGEPEPTPVIIGEINE